MPVGPGDGGLKGVIRLRHQINQITRLRKRFKRHPFTEPDIAVVDGPSNFIFQRFFDRWNSKIDFDLGRHEWVASYLGAKVLRVAVAFAPRTGPPLRADFTGKV